MRRITKHIIHCSDSEHGDVEEVRAWHLARGFRDVGYHFIIKRSGVVEVGRMMDEVGAHCKGYNAESIGTCLIGIDSFTIQQFNALRKLNATMVRLFPGVKTYEHNVFNSSKTCPNFNVKKVLMK
tara:strand:- start:159778 stop:160152 length:375 start_codon:yes stop_codon:yes gene_type:complete